MSATFTDIIEYFQTKEEYDKEIVRGVTNIGGTDFFNL